MGKQYISMLEASKLCSYDQDYLSLMARRGWIKADKIGKKWLLKLFLIKSSVSIR